MIEQTEKLNEITEEYEAYNNLFQEVNLDHPQRQGLFLDEFIRISNDPKAKLTEVIIHGVEVKVPQLAPVQGFEWLNDIFYSDRFPAETASDNLMYFMEIPGIVPGGNVVERIVELAEANGVLAFDTPSCDENMKRRVLEMLDNAGISYEEPELLGTQTYFAGQTVLKKVPTGNAPIAMSQTYDDGVSRGDYDPDSEEGVVLKHLVDETLALKMYSFYAEAYKVLNNHPCKQGLSPEEFYEMLTQEPELDKIMAMHEGFPESLYITCNNLLKLSWVNSQYYDKHYPEAMSKGQGVWFPGIATDPRPEVAGHNSEDIISFIAELGYRGDNGFLALFDFCDMNTSWLADHIANLINSTDEASVEIEKIAEQKYWSVRLSI